MKRELLTEEFAPSFQILESENSGDVYRLKGLFHLAETKNANGRIYPRKLLEREIRNIMPMIKNRQVIGELDHPMEPAIKLDKVSHVITELKMDGNKVYGVLETVKTEKGKELQGLIESGIKLGISSRGVGTLKEKEGVKVVQDDFQLLTWDVVPNPSTPDAWLSESEVVNFAENTKNDNSNKIIESVYDNELKIIEQVTKLFGGKNG